MANKPNDAGAKSTTSTLNSSWFKNTLKSLGSAGGAMIKDIMPATAETLGSATSSASDIVKSIRSSRSGVSNITKNLSNNQVVRSGQQFFKNAIDDLKSGKLYNTERDAMGGNEDLDPDSLFGDVEDVSFSDFGDEQPSQVNVVNQNVQQDGGMGAATLKAIEKSTEYNLQATKATVDTMVSISSTNMLGINRIGEEITNQLTAINSNLSALIEYNNTNMTKFIDASIGYYEQMSAKAAESNQSSDRIGVNDIYSANGGLDFKNYAKFIKQNAKDYGESTMVGGALKMFLDNKDMLIGGLVANPIGTALQFGMKSILPEVTKKAAKALDESIKDFIPVMLERIGNLDEITGPFSGISSFIAKTFGIKTERKEKINLERIDKGPMPYNGMANTAIIEIIPKHLREANSYLQTIAETLSGKFGDDAKGIETGFDWETGEFKDMNEIRKKFYDNLENTTADIFRGSKFGQKMASQKDLLKSEEDRKRYDDALTQLYGAIERHKGTLDFKNKDHMDEIMAGINSSQNIKTLIQSYINHLQETADEAIGNAMATKSKATREKNRVMQSAEDNLAEKNYRSFVNRGTYDQYVKEKYFGANASQTSPSGDNAKPKISLYGVVSNIYDLLSRGIYVKTKDFRETTPSGNGGSSTPPLNTSETPPTQTAEEFKAQFNAQSAATQSSTEDYEDLDELSMRQRFGVKSAKKINMFKGIIDGIMAGNSDKAFDELINAMRDKFHKAGEWLSEKFFTPMKKTLFGEKDEDGYRRGGIFEGVQNRMRESFFSLRRLINGKGYLTADGEKIEDANEDEMKNTVKGKLHGMLTFVKDGIKEKLFGKEPDEETGEEGKKGLLAVAKEKIKKGTNVFMKGLIGWKKALFGGDEDENSEEDGKRIWDTIKKKASDVLPTALAGSVIGIGGGWLASGILGTLVGGPIGGALLGLAGGIAARSDKFKDWLFGPEDQDGKRVGGVISEKTQDFIRDNGKYLAGGAALGLAKGILFPGSGLLVNLVGGPIAGAITGIGTSILFRSRMFQNFLFGNEDTGQRGLVNIVKGWFGKLGKKKDGDPSTGKLLGMAGIGVGVGALTGQAILNTGILGLSLGPAGPIGGALLGLGGAILAQKKNFKEWLFGTTDPETGEKRLGIIGKFGDMLRVNVGIPLKNTFLNIKDKFASFMEDHVLTKFNHIIEPIGNAIFGTISRFTGKTIDSLAGIGDVIKENFLQPAVEKLGKLMTPVIEIGRKALEAASSVAMTIIKTPINVLHAITSPIAQTIAKTVKTAAGLAATAVNLAVIKPVKNLVIKPLIGAAHLATNIISAPFKIVSNIATTIHDKVDHFVKHVSAFLVNVGNKFKDWLLNKNPVARTLRGAVAKIKDFGARVKNTFKIVVKPLGDFVKSAITEVKNQIMGGIGKFFSFINPINLIKGLYNLMRGRTKTEDKKKDRSKMGWLRQAWYLANPDVYGYDTPVGKDPNEMSEGERRKWARRDAKMGFTHERYTDKRDGTVYEYTKNKKEVIVTYSNGKREIISSEEFDKRFPKATREKLMKKTVDEHGNTQDAVFEHTKSGRHSKSEYDRTKAKKERENRAADIRTIKKWVPNAKAEDTAEMRMIAMQNAARKGKKLTFKNVNPADEARIKELNERLGKTGEANEAEESTAENTKETVNILDKIYFRLKFGFTPTDEQFAWYKKNKDKIDKKRDFFNGRSPIPEEYSPEEAQEHGASQARTYESEAYQEASRGQKKSADDKYSKARRNRADYNFEKFGFFEGFKRNWNDFKNYYRGGKKEIWEDEEDTKDKKDDTKESTHHAQGGSINERQLSQVGEEGAEFYQPANSSRRYIIAKNGPIFVELQPGDTIYPNAAVQAGTSAGDMSELTDAELISVTDTSKLSIDERMLCELISINQNMRLLSTAQTGFFGTPGGFTPEQFDAYMGKDTKEEPETELDEDGNPIEAEDSGYKTEYLGDLFHRFKGGAKAFVNAIPGSGLVKRAAHGIGDIFGFGRSILGAGFELGHNAFTATGHMFGHAKNAASAVKDVLTLEDKSSTELIPPTVEEIRKQKAEKDATVKDIKDATSETEEERKAREEKEHAAQDQVSTLSAENRQAELAEIKELKGDNLRDEERNSLLRKIGDKIGGFKSAFGSIFSKKGLIGAAILTGSALLSKLAPTLFKYGKLAISKIPSLSEIKDKVVNIWDNLPSWETVKATITSIPGKIKSLFGTVKDRLSQAWDWIYARWGDTIDTIKQWGITTGKRLKADAIYGWHNLGDGDRPVDVLQDEAVRFTKIKNQYGELDHESEARAKLKWKGYAGYADSAVRKISKDKYKGVYDWGTNRSGLRGLWDRIRGNKNVEVESPQLPEVVDDIKPGEIRNGVIHGGMNDGATVADNVAGNLDNIKPNEMRNGVIYATMDDGAATVAGSTELVTVPQNGKPFTAEELDRIYNDGQRTRLSRLRNSKLNPKNWFSKAAKSGADDAAKAVTKKTVTEDSLWKKCMTLLSDGINGIVEKVGAKLGSTRAVKGAKAGINGIKTLVEKCKPFFKNVATKIGKVLGVTAALGATVVGLAGKEITWITIGALNGLTGAQRLFRTDEVDTTMQVISTVIGGLLGTTVGSIVDIINELVVSVTGTDIISQLATVIYTAIMDFTGNKELSEKLREGQDEFKAKFEQDKTTSLKQQYSTMMQAGIIDKSVSEEEFIQGAEEGKYGARIKSFSDYNDEQHKNLGARVLDKAKGGLSNLKRSFIGETKTTYTDESGNVYTDAGDGMWLVTNRDGKELGTVGQDAIPENATENVEKTEGVLVKLGKGLLKFLKPIISVLGTVVPVVASDAANMLGGDPKGIIDNMPDIDEDTPGAGLSKALLFLTKVLTVPLSCAFWCIHKIIMPVLNPVIEGVSATVTGIVNSVSNAAGAMIDGNIMKLWGDNWDAKSHGFGDDDGVGGGIGAGLAYIVDVGARVLMTPFTLISAGLHLIMAPIIGFSEGVGEDWDKCKEAMDKGWAAADAGHPTEVWDATFECHDDNILSPIFHAIHIISNVFATIWGAIMWLPRRIGDLWDTVTGWFGGGDDNVGETREAFVDEYDRVVGKTTIPAHAEGTKNAAGGLSIVGEKGPEFVYNKESGTGYVVGKSGAELRHLDKGDVVVSNDNLDHINISDNITSTESDASTVVTDLSEINSTISNKIQSDMRVSNETNAASLEEARTLNATQETNLSETSDIKKILYNIYNMHAKYYAQIDYNNNAKYAEFASTANSIGSLFGDGDIYDETKKVSNISNYELQDDERLGAIVNLFGNGAGKRSSGGHGPGKPTGDELDKTVNTVTEKVTPLTKKVDTKEMVLANDDPNRVKYGKPITNLSSVQTDDIGIYYSQNDPRWAGIKLPKSNGEDDGATMSTSGCGPTALATALSDIDTNPNINPLSIAQYVVQEGYRDSTGTNAGFIEPSAARYGVSTHEAYRPSASSIERTLNKGNSVLLLGRHTGGDGVTPYTRAGHYIVATGMDNYGNIKIQDPRGSKYNISVSPDTLAKETVSMWSFNNSNPTLKRRRKIRKRYGGRGNEYLSWLQSDSRWGNMHLGNSNDTMTQSGCYVTTLAKLCMHTNSIAVDNFDPGWLCQYLNDANAFDDSGMLNTDCMTNLGLSKINNIPLKGKGETYIINECKKLIDKGYAIALWVTSNHVVAIVDVDENGTLIMSDPAQNAKTNVFEKYHASNVDELSYWRGASSPVKVNYEYKGEETGVIATAKKIVEPVAEVGGAFAKLAAAIFKAILTGNWDIDWDATFADEAEEGTTTAQSTGGVQSNNNDGRKTYTMDMDYTSSQINTSEDYDDGYWSYLKQIGFNDVGASVMTAYMHELSGLNSGVRKGLDFSDSHWKIDSTLPIHGFPQPFLPTLEDTPFTGKDSDNKKTGDSGDKTYTFLVNSGMYGLDKFMNDAAESGKGIPYGLFGWTGSDLKKALYEYTFENGSDISDPKIQIQFIKDRLLNYDESLYKALTEANGVNYTTMMRMMPDFVSEMTGCDPTDVKTDDIHNLAMTYYNSFAGGKITNANISKLLPKTTTKFDKWLKEKDYNKLHDLISRVKGNRSVKIVDDIKDTWDAYDKSYAESHGYLIPSQFDALKQSISDIYNARSRDIPETVISQMYKNRDADEFGLIARYADASAMLDNTAEDEKSIVQSIIDKLEQNASIIKPKHKLAENLYEKDMNYIYDVIKSEGKTINDIDLDMLSDYGLFDLYNKATDKDLRTKIISKIRSNKEPKKSIVEERLITDSTYMPFDTSVVKGLGIEYPLYQVPHILRYMEHDDNRKLTPHQANAIIIGDNIVEGNDAMGLAPVMYALSAPDRTVKQYTSEEYIDQVEKGNIRPYILHKLGGNSGYKWSLPNGNSVNIDDIKTSENLLNSTGFKSYIDDVRYNRLLTQSDLNIRQYMTKDIYKKWRRELLAAVKSNNSTANREDDTSFSDYTTSLFDVVSSAPGILSHEFWDKVERTDNNDVTQYIDDSNPEIISTIGSPPGTNSALEYFTSNQIIDIVPDRRGIVDDTLKYLDYPFGKYDRKYNTNILNSQLHHRSDDAEREKASLVNKIQRDWNLNSDAAERISNLYKYDNHNKVYYDHDTFSTSTITEQRPVHGKNGAFGDGPNATTKSYGGSGDGVNGSTYYSQNDPRWASTKFIKSNGEDDGATISNTGCGPTAMAMALSDVTGHDINPMQTAKLAQTMGTRDSTGVNWNFIDQAASRFGVNSYQSLNPSREFLETSLRTGDPVILSGVSNDKSSIYTPSGHYVVAYGEDSRGNVLINDPRGKNFSHRVPLNELLRTTDSAWLLGSKTSNIINSFKRGGRGGITAADVINTAIDEIGYLEKPSSASSDDLKSKTANPNTGDSGAEKTKYCSDLGMGGGYWCAAFVSWCVYMACGKDMSATSNLMCGGISASCGSIMSQFQSNNQYYTSDPKPGDFVLFNHGDTDHDHIGIVGKVNGSTIITIEGNSENPSGGADGVFVHTYDINNSDVRGFCRPEYSGQGNIKSIPNVTGGDAQGDSGATQAETDEISRASALAEKAGNEIFKAGYTGNWDIDWDAVFAEQVASDTSGTSSNTGTGSTSVRGSDNAEKIFNWFKDNTKFTDAGIAGIMGNWNQESGLQPNNLENSFESELGYDDESYSDAVSSGKYTRDQFIHDAEHRPSYVKYCGTPVGAGYGLGQWTSGGRKGDLYDATVGRGLRIDDLGGQLSYAMNEMRSGTDRYNALINILETTDSPNEAADEFLSKFEGCPGHSSLPNRQSFANEFYNRFHGGSGIGHGATLPKNGTRDASRYKEWLTTLKVKKNGGGFGDGPNIKSVKYIDQASPKSAKQSSDNTASQDSTTWLSSSALSYEEQQYTRGNRDYSDDSLKRMVQDVLVELKTISANSDNLTYLKDINSSMSDSHNLYVANNTTNNMVNNNSSKRVGQRVSGPSHNEQMARRIAFGR